MIHPLVIVERSEDVTTIILNRKEKRNALSLELLEQLYQAIQETVAMEGQRAIVLTGNGLIFCAGMDLYEASKPENVDSLADLLAKTFSALYFCPLVTIAAVNGAALAGGAGLMSACDFVVAASNAKLGYPEIHHGLVAAQVSTLLTRQVGWRAVREVLLLGEPIDAEKALQIGLINYIVPPDELVPHALKLAQQAAKNVPAAVAETKKLLIALESHPLKDDLKLAIEVYRKIRLSTEAQEKMTDFLTKKKKYPPNQKSQHDGHKSTF